MKPSELYGIEIRGLERWKTHESLKCLGALLLRTRLSHVFASNFGLREFGSPLI